MACTAPNEVGTTEPEAFPKAASSVRCGHNPVVLLAGQAHSGAVDYFDNEKGVESSRSLKRRRAEPSCSADSSDTTTSSLGSPVNLQEYIERLHVAVEYCLVEGLSKDEAILNLVAEGWHKGAVSVVWARLESENNEFFSLYNTRLDSCRRRKVVSRHVKQAPEVSENFVRSSRERKSTEDTCSDSSSESGQDAL